MLSQRDACFSSMPSSASLAACRGQIHGLPTCRIPWRQGKMQGISPIQPLFAKDPSRKHLRIQQFASEFPTQTSREFFCQRRELIRASRDVSREIRSIADGPNFGPSSRHALSKSSVIEIAWKFLIRKWRARKGSNLQPSVSKTDKMRMTGRATTGHCTLNFRLQTLPLAALSSIVLDTG